MRQKPKVCCFREPSSGLLTPRPPLFQHVRVDQSRSLHPCVLTTHAQYEYVQKQESIEGLVLGRRRDVFIHREVGEKGANRGCVQITRMSLSVKKNETLNPVAVGLFSSKAEMPEAGNIANLIEQFPGRHGD